MRRPRQIGQLFGVTITISVGIVGALVLIVLGLCLAYAFLPTERALLDFIALALTAAGGVGGAFYLAESLRAQVEQQRSTEAFALMARWNSPDLLDARRAWHTISDTFQDKGAAAVKDFLLDPKQTDQVLNVRHVLNFLEEIAMAVTHEHADEDLLHDFFAGIVKRAHEALGQWIPDHRRKTGRNTIWERFDQLYTRWETGYPIQPKGMPKT
jgi:Domain of unknown function (DUF4760)